MENKKITALQDRVIFRRLRPKTVTESGIELGDAPIMAEVNVRGEVISVGPKVTTIEVGEIVLVSVYKFHTFDAGGILYGNVADGNIIGKFKEFTDEKVYN